jgi:hypothetical protein
MVNVVRVELLCPENECKKNVKENFSMVVLWLFNDVLNILIAEEIRKQNFRHSGIK